jgi:hypothetical protein
MKGKEIYPLVYSIVKRAQKENPNLKNFASYYEWSMRIPKPKDITDELADAICTSISCSEGAGLEIYYQEKVYLIDLQSIFLYHQLAHFSYFLNESSSDEKNFRTIGDIIRTVFEGRKVPNKKDKELLNAL